MRLSTRRLSCPPPYPFMALLVLVGFLLPGCGGGSGSSANKSGGAGNLDADRALAQAHNTRVRGRLKKFQVQFNLYQMEHDGAPATFDALQAAADPQDRFTDDRTGQDIPFTFLPPGDTADDMDLLAHTDPAGPLPILGVKLNGQVVDFPTVDDFQKHMDWQQNHPAPRTRDPQSDLDRDPTAPTAPAADPSLAPDPDAPNIPSAPGDRRPPGDP